MFVLMRYETLQNCVAKLRSGSCPQKTLFIADHVKLWGSQRGKHAVTAALIILLPKDWPGKIALRIKKTCNTRKCLCVTTIVL